MLKTLPNVDVRFNTQLQEVVSSGTSSVTIKIRQTAGEWVHKDGGEHIYVLHEEQCGESATLEARYLVGCDGSKSVVRKYINPQKSFISLNYDKEWIAVDIMLKDERLIGNKLSSYSQFICTAERQYIVIPCSYCYDRPSQGRHVRFDFAVAKGDPVDRAEIETKEFVQTLVAPWFDEDDYELIRGAVYRFHCLMAPQWKRNNVIIVGDAAHTQAPFLGQGLNQGIKDIANLWWKLSAVLNGKTGASLLDTYQTERYEVALNVVSHAKQLGVLLNKLSEAQTDGNAQVHATAAEAERVSDVKLGKLWNLAYSTIAIPRKVNTKLKSKYDGKMIQQFRVQPIHPASPFTSILLDDLLPQTTPFVVLLVGLHNTVSEYFTDEERRFLRSVSMPIYRIALRSQRKELPNTVVPVYWVDEEQDPEILLQNDVIVLRRDAFIFGAASNPEDANILIKELEYSDWFLSLPRPASL